MEKDYLINKCSEKEFEEFLINDNNGEILKLLDNEGIEILKKSYYRTQINCIECILHCSKYCDELFKISKFVDCFLDTDTDLYCFMENVSLDTAKILMDAAVKKYPESQQVAHLFDSFEESIKLNMLDNWAYSSDILYYLLLSVSPKVVNKILKNYPISLSGHNLNYISFFGYAKDSIIKNYRNKMLGLEECEEIHIPSHMITNKVAEEIYSKYDIYTVRGIINDMNHSTDSSVVNDFIKKKEEEEIYLSTSKDLLNEFQNIYETFKNMKELEKRKDELNNDETKEYRKFRNQYIKLLRKIGDDNLNELLNELYQENGLEEVFKYLKSLNDYKISNYIIDYHFEENYYNIMLDMNELLNFYFNGNISLDEERLALYEKIVNIDLLDRNEKLELHEMLKNYKIMEMFYDDMAFARGIVAEAIRDYSLTREELQKYKDEDLSQAYGVPVFVINNEPFFGIVKSYRHVQDTLPTGHSFSLIGNGGLAVYGDVSDSNTFLYDSSSLTKEQLVHAYPYDAYTMFKPFELEKKPSNRVFTLMMPDELVEHNNNYNELLFLEKGTKETEYDNKIPELKKIALYCLDKIREQDITVAKDNRVGIFLVNSKECQKSDNEKRGIYQHHIDGFNYNYYTSYYDKQKFDEKRGK